MPTAVRTGRPAREPPSPKLRWPNRRWPNRRLLWTGAAVAAVLVAVLTWLLWPARAPAPEPPRARSYLEFTACLLTGERGITDPAVAPVWAGLQEASLTTHVKVQYLAVTGPQTIDNAITFLNSLAQSGCNLIFSAGDIPNATVDRGAGQFPDASFFPVGGGTAARNVTPIQGTPDESRAAVAGVLTAAVTPSTR